MYNGYYFEYPYVGLVLLLFIICAKFCKQRMDSIYFPHMEIFSSPALINMRFISLLKWLGLTLVIMALMSPVKDSSVSVKPMQGYDIALVLDASQSMSARGFDQANPMADRFVVVKEIVNKFISQRVSDNLGVVVFGEYSFIASPLTYDKHILSRVVNQLYIGMAGKFTALYESIAQAANLLKGSKAKSKVIILLTDGYDSGRSKITFDVALSLAKKEGVKIYAIGIGAPNEYNGAVLQEISKESGGVAFSAQNSTQLEKIYKKIDELEKSEIEREEYSFKNYYYHFFLFGGLIILLAYLFFRSRR